MRLSRLILVGQPQTVIHQPDGGLVAVNAVTDEPDERSLLARLADPAERERLQIAMTHARPVNATDADVAMPVTLDHVLGIGLNYRPHAEDLGAPLPEEPAWFTKLARTAVPDGEEVLLPPDSQRVTAEAELGLIIGRPCWRVDPDDALDHIAGAVAILDHCAEDILQRNTRFLTRSKNFPSFLTVGPDMVTLDELTAERPLAEVEVATVSNDDVVHRAPVSQMLFDPAQLIHCLSSVVPLEPGDVITTGTPGAVALGNGDRVEGRVSGLGTVRAVARRPAPSAYRDEALAQRDRLAAVFGS